MAEVDSSIRQAGEVLEDVAKHPWMERIARFGYATKGIVYIVIGALATMMDFGLGGEATDTRGALRVIEDRPFGKVALATVAFGLIGYVAWRLLQGIADPDEKGTSLKAIAVRIGYCGSGLVYAGLALTAAKALIDVDEPDSSTEVQQDWVSQILTMSYGNWLVGLAGASVLIFGLYQIYKGVSAKFRKRLKLGEMSETGKFWATLSGRIGYAARGVVFCIVGVFLIQAARHFNPSEARGLDGVFQKLSEWPFGKWAMGAVAAGLIAYGFYMLVEARHRRIAGS